METPFMSEFMYSAVPALPTWKPAKSKPSSNESTSNSRRLSQQTDSNGGGTTTASGQPRNAFSSASASTVGPDRESTADNNAHARSHRSLIRSASRSSSSHSHHHYWLTKSNSASSAANESTTSTAPPASTTDTSTASPYKLDGRQDSSSSLARARSNSAAPSVAATNKSNKDTLTATAAAAATSGNPSRKSLSSTALSARTRLTAAGLSAVTSGTSSTSFTPRKQKHKGKQASISGTVFSGSVPSAVPLPSATASSPPKPHPTTTARHLSASNPPASNKNNSKSLFHVDSIAASDLKHVAMYPDVTVEPYRPPAGPKVFHSPSGQVESASSTSLATAQSGKTVQSEQDASPAQRPLVQRNGRSYLRDPANPYPLPVDLTELHRQSLRTLLLIQVHGAPVASPALIAKPPLKVLEIGCGSGFWSMMCHRYFKSRGHGGIHFTGVDVVSVAPSNEGSKPDPDMQWTFVQHDLCVAPWPFADGEFDMVFHKDMALACPTAQQPTFLEESIRVLKSGGTLEIWETDHSIRMLRKHVPSASAANTQVEEQEAASTLGAYVINTNTPLSPPQSAYLQEYNGWLKRAMDARGLMVEPCTVVNYNLLSEAESLKNIGSHRVAIPFSEVRWEREGVGGIVTKDGKSYPTKLNREQPPQSIEKKTLTAGQAALRRTALITLIEEIQALEPLLREQSGKSQDEWDMWMSKMTTTLLNGGDYDTRWGECLESGAWWATKR